jgi:hypothetical protein
MKIASKGAFLPPKRCLSEGLKACKAAGSRGYYAGNIALDSAFAYYFEKRITAGCSNSDSGMIRRAVIAIVVHFQNTCYWAGSS